MQYFCQVFSAKKIYCHIFSNISHNFPCNFQQISYYDIPGSFQESKLLIQRLMHRYGKQTECVEEYQFHNT